MLLQGVQRRIRTHLSFMFIGYFKVQNTGHFENRYALVLSNLKSNLLSINET